MIRPRLTAQDLEILVPQWQAARDILRRWPLGGSVDELAALLVLKTVAITWKQVSDALSHDERTPVILRLYLSGNDKGYADVPARVTHDHETRRTSLVVDWPEGLDGRSVIGFTLTAGTEPLMLNAGDTLVLPLPPVIGAEP